MANHHLTGMLANNRHPVMPVQTGIQSPSTGMPAKLVLASGKRRARIQNTPTVMPAQAGIHPSRTGHWIPACAGMTAAAHLHRFVAARRETALLVADEANIAELQDVEKAVAKKRRKKGSSDA